jgi:hypothetical protein
MFNRHHWLEIAKNDCGLTDSVATFVARWQGDKRKANDSLGRVTRLYLRTQSFFPDLAPEPRTQQAVRTALASLLQTPPRTL